MATTVARIRDWESTFSTWAQGPSKTEQEKAENAERQIYQAISNCRHLQHRDIRVFTQGSYRNRVNVRRDSLLLLLASSETAPSLKEIGAAQTADTPPSRLLRSLRDRKLVRQTRDKLDERIWRFTLTAQGKRMADVVQKCKVDLAKQWGRDLSKGSLGPTVKLLRQLSTGL